MGALTYVKNEEIKFKIPNEIAKNEYLEEILRISCLTLTKNSIQKFQILMS